MYFFCLLDSISLPSVEFLDTGKEKPTSRKLKGSEVPVDSEINKCLLRATVGRKKKISTIISSKDVTKFQMVRFAPKL